MSTFIIKNVVKSYANDLTLIAATQIALFKKLLYTWKKNILFATLFTNSDQLLISLTMGTLRSISQCGELEGSLAN